MSRTTSRRYERWRSRLAGSTRRIGTGGTGYAAPRLCDLEHPRSGSSSSRAVLVVAQPLELG